MNNKRVSIIIPAYNEEKVIKKVIEEIIRVDPSYEIIAIDDGSTDFTYEILRKIHGIIVKRHPYNIGNGATVRTGIESASGDVVVCMDADGQHDPREILKLIKHIPGYDMVVGARTNNRNVSTFRKMGNYVLIKIAEYLSAHKIDDLTSGFRAMKMDKVEGLLHMFPLRYSYPTTVTMAFLFSGYSVKYVPLESITKRETGKSNIKPFRDGFRFMNTMLKIVMLFTPQKIFLPVSIFFLFIGLVLGIKSIVLFGKLVQSSLLMIVIGVFVFFFGLLAEQIAAIRREINRSD